MNKLWIGETILSNATSSGPNGNWWTKKRMTPEASDFFLKNLNVFSPLKKLPIEDFRNLISGLDEGNLSKPASRGGRSVDIVLLKDLLISEKIVNIEPKKEDLNIPAEFKNKPVEVKNEPAVLKIPAVKNGTIALDQLNNILSVFKSDGWIVEIPLIKIVPDKKIIKFEN